MPSPREKVYRNVMSKETEGTLKKKKGPKEKIGKGKNKGKNKGKGER